MTMLTAEKILPVMRVEPANPFAEAHEEAAAPMPAAPAVGFAPWSENLTPFIEMPDRQVAESDAERLIAEALAELRDEAFDEAVAFLAEETEQAVGERFTDESAYSSADRERFAEAHLAPVRFEAEQYLQGLQSSLTGMDLNSLSPEQLDEVLDRFDPQPAGLTPAGEEFIGGLIKKAKSVVKFVANAAKTVGKVAGSLVLPGLGKLLELVKPLLKRVLSFAIGRLPAALQPAARALAARFTSEAAEADEAQFSPATATDVEMLAESFDVALAEAITSDRAGEAEGEAFPIGEGESDFESRDLERLAEARGVLIDQLRDADAEQDLAPPIEQFVPVLLAALRIGINLVGRPKVVGFLAQHLAKLIGKWVGPQVSGPLSSAIVDTGLRLVSLEAEADGRPELSEREAAPVALAGVIEDAVRRFSENEEYVFEDEGLMQLAAAEAVNQAVATHFPPRFVRPALQQAPSLGGTFVARRPRSVRTYRKYSRTPQVEITEQIAEALPTFGGSTLGAVLRAAGARFPIKARMHIYEAAVGTSLPRMIRLDRASAAAGRGYVSSASLHPLTPEAASALLREPRLGVHVPAEYLRSRHRVAVGQRFYLLEPVGAASALSLAEGPGSRAAAGRLAPTRARTVVNLRRGRVTVGVYLSETDAQRIVEAIRQGRGALTLLQALTAAYESMDRLASGAHPPLRIVREDHEGLAQIASHAARLLPPAVAAGLRKQLRAWVLPALAEWARTHAETFARAAAHPDSGVTVRVRLTAVPGLDVLGQAANALRGTAAPATPRGTPSISIAVAPGTRRQ